MKKLIFSTILLALSNLLISQSTFEKTYQLPIVFGGTGLQVEQTPDNGYTLITQHFIPFGDWAYFIIKTNAEGDTLYSKELVQLSPIDFCITADGGYMAFGNGIVRLNETFDTLWTKPFWNFFGPGSIIRTADNNYVLTHGWGSITKINENGDSLWTREYGGAWARQVIQCFDSGFIFVNNSPNSPTIITKTDIDGIQEWTQTYNDISLNSICQASNGDFLAAGYIFDGQNPTVLRIDSIGNIIWNETYIFESENEGTAICETEEDSFVISIGRVYSFSKEDSNEGFLLNIDGNGDIIWSQAYGKALTDVKLTNDNGLIATGRDTLGEIYLIKTNLEGLITSFGEEMKKNIINVELFPNPASNTVAIISNNGETVKEVNIYNQTGRKSTASFTGK